MFVLTLQSGGGTLTFADQQRFTYITIVIRDNNVAELDKTFQVQLSSPTQGGRLKNLHSYSEKYCENNPF